MNHTDEGYTAEHQAFDQLKADNARLRGLLTEAGNWLAHLPCGTACQCQGEQDCGLKLVKRAIDAELKSPKLPAPTQGETPHVDRALGRIAAQHAAAGKDEGQTP